MDIYTFQALINSGIPPYFDINIDSKILKVRFVVFVLTFREANVFMTIFGFLCEIGKSPLNKQK